MNKAVMLAYFAQRPQEYLQYLEKERRQVSESCFYGEFTFISRSGDEATIEQLMQDVNERRDDIVAFHYSGHADSTRIFFENETGSATGLANLLGKCPNLRFVFLNGCSTRDQVTALFANNIRIVIASYYRIADLEAYVFSRQFYTQLFKKNTSMIDAFRSAIVDLASKEQWRAVLPESLTGNESSIQPVHYRGIGREVSEQVWGIFTSIENDPILKAKQWLPGKRLKVQLERAYTCGRNPIRSLFRDHYQTHINSRSVFHYLTVDKLKNSPEGLSIKLLFENFTRDHDASQPVPWLYLADPNLHNFKDKVIELYANDRSQEEIIERIYNRIHGRSDVRSAAARTFQDLYNIPDVGQRRQVFLFLRVSEKTFGTIRPGITSFIEKSLSYDSEQRGVRPQLFFFWHLIAEQRFLQLRSFRSVVARHLETIPDVSFLHENPLKPLPALEQDDFREWVSQNEIDPEVGTAEEALKILESHRDDIPILEVELRAFIKGRRNTNQHD
ncbi:MAG: CHAT domain-containing protein [Chryseolinea sp.]